VDLNPPQSPFATSPPERRGCKGRLKKGLERGFTRMGKFEKEEIFVLNFQ
jgi:hypothetical protein